MLGVLLGTFKPVLQQIRVLQVGNVFCSKWRVVLLFATKSVHVALFTGLRRTCFAASDVTSLNGVTPAQLYPIRSQYSGNLQQPDLLQDRFD